MHVFVVGLNHRSAPLWLRERVAFAPESGAASALAVRAGVGEALVLSTCNRVEAYAVAPGGAVDEAVERVVAALAERAGVEPAVLRAHAYVHAGDAAARHLCRVAAGLDSLLVGEAQVTGQLKRAFGEACADGAAGRVLHRLASTALAAGRRARARLARAAGPASVAELAVHAAGGAAGLADRVVVVLGAGETALGVLDAVAHAHARRVVVVNRSPERGARAAGSHRAEAAPWDALGAVLAEADVVFACTAAPEPVVVPAHLAAGAAGAPGRTRVVVDLGVPRNVDPAVAALDGVTLFDVDALGTCRGPRRAAAAPAVTDEAEAAVGEWVARFSTWLRAQEVVPTIAELRAGADRIREQELDRALSRLGHLGPREQAVVRALAARLVNKLLHAPVATLSGAPETPALATSARLLFGLEGVPAVLPASDAHAAPRA